jgi:ABC-type lipoprotein release transport system permease subunit
VRCRTAIAALVLAAIAASVIPARRAARADPIITLRSA